MISGSEAATQLVVPVTIVRTSAQRLDDRRVPFVAHGEATADRAWTRLFGRVLNRRRSPLSLSVSARFIAEPKAPPIAGSRRYT